MRAWPIELTRQEFDQFFYRYVTNVAAENEAEHLVSLRLLEKLQDPDVTFPQDPLPDVIAAVEARGDFWAPAYRLSVDAHVFLLEEDEKRLALKRLNKNIEELSPRAGPGFEIVRQKVIKAEPIDLTPAAGEVGPAEEVPLGDVSSLLEKAAEKTEAEQIQEPADA